MAVDANSFQKRRALSAFRNSAFDEKGSATERRVFAAVLVLQLRAARARG
jgi:hypothetical protein